MSISLFGVVPRGRAAPAGGAANSAGAAQGAAAGKRYDPRGRVGVAGCGGGNTGWGGEDRLGGVSWLDGIEGLVEPALRPPRRASRRRGTAGTAAPGDIVSLCGAGGRFPRPRCRADPPLGMLVLLFRRRAPLGIHMRPLRGVPLLRPAPTEIDHGGDSYTEGGCCRGDEIAGPSHRRRGGRPATPWLQGCMHLGPGHSSYLFPCRDPMSVPCRSSYLFPGRGPILVPGRGDVSVPDCSMILVPVPNFVLARRLPRMPDGGERLRAVGYANAAAGGYARTGAWA